MNNILNNVFDKIYVINCGNEKNIKFQESKSNLQFEVVDLFKFPQTYDIFNLLSLYERTNCTNAFNLSLTLTYYNIIVNSYNKYDKILIFDDSFNLMKTEYINEYIEKLNNDFDILQLSNNENNIFVNNLFNDLYLNKIYFVKAENGFNSVNGLGLSKNGMAFIINFFENNKLSDINVPIFENGNHCMFELNHYVSTIPFVYLEQNNSDENLDKSKYNINNI